ncbi:MAG: hypothetical protein U1A24_07345 [Cypionkella sp.]|uniref:hypothetical protein n=1 Tax=Cypionkella sp. TaxID=2811411 RepID=UPI002ABA8CF5|nr:hypothetical protein [Cypionkella sp.]MDZ4310355.1 hypothetical protein [Cypionkella sp.]MDZ4391892.1 hypothetical protein [Cypionkella sp.]
MRVLRLFALGLGLTALAACQTNDLKEPPVPLGDFRLGLNIAVADNVQKVPISRDASKEDWEAAIKKAVDDRFGRYEGDKLYNIGISIDGYALAPPGVPLVLKPKSVLVVTANIWDDAARKKLNPEGKQLTIFEHMSAETVIGSGVTQNKKKQMEILSYNAAKSVEKWLLDNPEWFGLPAKGKAAAAATPAPAIPAATTPAAPVEPAPVIVVTPKPAKVAPKPAKTPAKPAPVLPIPTILVPATGTP